MGKKEEEMVKKTIICPKCGHENLFPSKECARCGSSFILFPELRGLFDKGKRRNGKVKEPISKTDDQKGKPLICPKCGQENDSLSVECSKCGIVFLKYYDIQSREETDEEKIAELLAKKKKEEEKAEFLAKKKEEEERAEALKKQKEEEERIEALRQQKEEEERIEALRRQKEEEQRAEALRKQKEEEDRAAALRRQKEEEERIEALRRQKEEEEKKELQKKIEDITNVLKPKAKIKDLLKQYEGQTIGINHDSPTEIKGADLIKVGDDLFSILLMDEKLLKSYPLRTITSVIEGVNGVSDGNMEEKSKFSIVILVHHPVF
jgi:ribosomal protein L37E